MPNKRRKKKRYTEREIIEKLYMRGLRYSDIERRTGLFRSVIVRIIWEFRTYHDKRNKLQLYLPSDDTLLVLQYRRENPRLGYMAMAKDVTIKTGSLVRPSDMFYLIAAANRTLSPETDPEDDFMAAEGTSRMQEEPRKDNEPEA